MTVTLSPWATTSVNPPQPPPLTRITKRDFFASYIETHYSEFVGPLAPAPQLGELPIFAAAPLRASTRVSAATPVALQPRAVDAAHVVLLSTKSRNSLALAEAVAETRATEPVEPAVVASPALNAQSFRASLLASRWRG